MDVKKYVSMIQPQETVENNTLVATVVKKKSDIVYSVEHDGIDFVITRRASRRGKPSKLVVLMSQQKVFFIKNIQDEKENGDIEAADSEGIAKFMASLDADYIATGTTWLPWMFRGKSFAETLLDAVRRDTVNSLSKKNLIEINENTVVPCIPKISQAAQKVLIYAFNDIPGLSNDECFSILRREIGEHSRGSYHADASVYKMKTKNLIGNIDTIETMIDFWGLDNARKYVREWMLEGQLLEFIDQYSMEEIKRRKVEFDFSSFMEYTVHEAVRQGFNNSMRNFMNTWLDTLRLEKYVKEKIYDKYPENLLSLHQILATKSTEIKNAHDLKAFEDRASRLKEFEWSHSGSPFMIKVPTKVSDMIDEAHQQSNCLASYVSAFAEGRSKIFFLRRKAEPEKSVGTIEVVDNTIRQALGKSNRWLTFEEMTFVISWAKKMGFEVGDRVNRAQNAIA